MSAAGRRPSLPGYALMAATLASAGLPIYIHAPKFYVDTYGVSLTALAGVLTALRLLDVVQDPALGWLSARFRDARRISVAVAGGVLALSMLALFAVAPPLPPLIWFALFMAGLFSAFSFLTICMYSEGVSAATRLGPKGHLTLAGWRETGALIGVCLASIAPTVLGFTTDPFAVFAFGFAALTALAVWAMRHDWRGASVKSSGGFRSILSDHLARRLLLIAFLNATPVAVSSTLFLFYVEAVLESPGWEGPLLLAFFVSAAIAAPIWSALATWFGTRRMLMTAMVLSIASFAFVYPLGSGDVWPFLMICLVSGFALGADFALLPAAFATRMSEIAPDASEAFGLWAFVSKATLAVATITLLPTLDAAGLRGENGPTAASLSLLTSLYAGAPCALKLLALGLLAATPLPQDNDRKVI